MAKQRPKQRQSKAKNSSRRNRNAARFEKELSVIWNDGIANEEQINRKTRINRSSKNTNTKNISRKHIRFNEVKGAEACRVSGNEKTIDSAVRGSVDDGALLSPHKLLIDEIHFLNESLMSLEGHSSLFNDNERNYSKELREAYKRLWELDGMD